MELYDRGSIVQLTGLEIYLTRRVTLPYQYSLTFICQAFFVKYKIHDTLLSQSSPFPILLQLLQPKPSATEP